MTCDYLYFYRSLLIFFTNQLKSVYFIGFSHLQGILTITWIFYNLVIYLDE